MNPDPFDQAFELLKQQPLPADIIEQLDRLRKKVPRGQREQFDQLYEGAIVLDETGEATK